jgi:hypothetical protein
VIECQYEQEPFNAEDVIREPDGDDEKDLYDDKDLASKKKEDMVISDKSSRDIMEDYFGVPLNTTV